MILSVRAKRRMKNKRVLIRKIFNFSYSVHGRNTTILIFYLHRKVLIFLRNDRNCKVVKGLDIFDKVL